MVALSEATGVLAKKIMETITTKRRLLQEVMVEQTLESTLGRFEAAATDRNRLRKGEF